MGGNVTGQGGSISVARGSGTGLGGDVPGGRGSTPEADGGAPGQGGSTSDAGGSIPGEGASAPDRSRNVPDASESVSGPSMSVPGPRGTVSAWGGSTSDAGGSVRAAAQSASGPRPSRRFGALTVPSPSGTVLSQRAAPVVRYKTSSTRRMAPRVDRWGKGRHKASPYGFDGGCTDVVPGRGRSGFPHEIPHRRGNPCGCPFPSSALGGSNPGLAHIFGCFKWNPVAS